MFGFDYCPGTPECDLPTTKYRSWGFTGTYQLGHVDVDEYGHCTVVLEGDPVAFSGTLTVESTTGKILISNCSSDDYSKAIIKVHYELTCPADKDTEWNPPYNPPDENGCGEWDESFTRSNTTYTHHRYGATMGTTHIIEYTITVTLSDEYTLEEVGAEAFGLAGFLSLADQHHLPWNPYPYNGYVRWIYYDESGANSPLGAAGILDILNTIPGPDLCGWVDNGPYTGNIIGGPGDPVIYPDVQTEGAYNYCSLSGVVLQKWAATIPTTDSYNHFRPCGADRDDARFPNAWPICGRCAVASATQNGANVDIVLADSAPYLRTGDYVDFSGVGGLGNNLQVTVTDATHFSVPGTLSGPYSGGGFTSSHGAPSYWFNDDDPKGDYVYLRWTYNRCTLEGQFSCSQECMTTRCGTPVACISPNEETFPAGDTFDFPDAAKGLCWQGLPLWTLEDYLWDPNQGVGPVVEARCEPPIVNGETPPPLPPGFTYGVSPDPSDHVPPGGCIDAEWL